MRAAQCGAKERCPNGLISLERFQCTHIENKHIYCYRIVKDKHFVIGAYDEFSL